MTDLFDHLKSAFADSYAVERELPGGGMSRLFLAIEHSLHRKVVLKILPPDVASEIGAARFKREAEVTAHLQHPHILPIIGAGLKDGLLYYIMPFVEGESLKSRLERDGKLPIRDAVRIIREVADALAYAHQHGVIHRDIKPANILLEDGHAVLADFGIAAALSGPMTDGGDRLTRTGTSVGTVGYMAPEQSLGERNLDGRVDIYALGVVGYEILAGEPPFTAPNAQAIIFAHLTEEPRQLDRVRFDTPLAVCRAIDKALRKTPEERFQSAAEFRDALDVPTSSVPRFSMRASLHRLQLAPRRLKVLTAVAAAAVISLVGVGALLAWRQNLGGDSDSIVIAIAPFNVLNSDLQLWHEGMVDLMSRNLDGAGPLRTVSPTVAIRGWKGPADRTSVTALARRTRARYGVFGTLLGGERDSVRLRAALLDVSTGKLTEIEYRGAEMDDVADSLSVTVLRELGQTEHIAAVRRAPLGARSLPALKAFLRGEQHYRRTAWDSAVISYERALASDANFALPLRRLGRIASWQYSEQDPRALQFALRASALNHGLAPRDSLLLTSDSLMAALTTADDSLTWSRKRRLFATIAEAARRYSDDPEVWYTVGEARYHHGYGREIGVTDGMVLDAFKRSIELDSAFAPAYIHAIEQGFTVEGATAGLRYARAYLVLHPTDKEAEGIELLERVVRPRRARSPETATLLDTLPFEVVRNAWSALRRWPDSAETSTRLLRVLADRSRNTAASAADSLWILALPVQLAFRGHLREARQLLGSKPARVFAELVLFGGIPEDSASAVFARWLEGGASQASFAAWWWASRGDTASLHGLVRGLDSTSRSASTPTSRRATSYRLSAAQAYLTLARRDTVNALAQFLALSDTLCLTCTMFDGLTTARLLAANKRYDEALEFLGSRLYTLISPLEVAYALERGRLAQKQGDTAAAREAYSFVADAWMHADPALEPALSEARAAVAQVPRQMARSSAARR